MKYDIIKLTGIVRIQYFLIVIKDIFCIAMCRCESYMMLYK